MRFIAAGFLTIIAVLTPFVLPAFAQQGTSGAPPQAMPPQMTAAGQTQPQPSPATQPPAAQPATAAAPAEPQPAPANPFGDMLTQANPEPSTVVPVTSDSDPASGQMIAPPPQEQLVPQDPVVSDEPDQENKPRDIDRVPVSDSAESATITNMPPVNMDVTDMDAANATLDMPIEKEESAALNNEGINMDLDPSLVDDDGLDGEVDLSRLQAEIPYEEQLRQRTKEIEQRARSEAFELSKRAALPLETYQIRDVLRRLKDTQEAIQKPVRKAPTPQNVIKTISIDPAAKSEVVNLYVGNVTALNIVDMTGAPWPIVDIAFGGNFDVKAPEPGGNILRITPLRDFAQGNMVIRLLKMTTPITFTLMAGGDVVNYRFDARIPSYGPNARMPIIEEGIMTAAGDGIINSVLEGITPNTGEKLTVEGVDARTSAYRINGSMYVRTPFTMLSPSWRSSATSADGMNVYVLAEAPVILLSDQGKLMRARLSPGVKALGE